MKKRAEKDTKKAKETISTEKESPMENRYDISDEQEETEEEDEENEVEDEESNKIRELNDKYLRLYSEFDNYRRRTLQEKIELSKTASAGIITELLPILDDFDRAMKAFSETRTADASLKDGIVLIYTKFLNLLTQKGLQQMKTIGEPFDTDFHEAITMIQAPKEEMKGHVVDEVEKGYILNGKVIRFAKVVVGN